MSSQALNVRNGQYRALWLTTIAFTLCFAIWTIFSILGIQIKTELSLTETQMALLMAIPILSGSLSRILLGMFTERWGGRIVFSTLMYLAAISAYWLSIADSYNMLLIAGVGLGLAGGGFIVGATYVAAWFETQKQGAALGIFGAGNVGAALTTFGAPFLLGHFSWQETAQIYGVILAIFATLYVVFSKTEPRRLGNFTPPKFSEQLALLHDIRIWRFALYYFFVFGAFVALALWLPHYLINVYDVSLVTAGILTSLYIIPGSLFRILGGFWSDKYGARRIMYW
ncbi:MAG: MFS transporter, partial [Shewanella sp.]